MTLPGSNEADEPTGDDFAAMMHASNVCVLVHDADTKNILWANTAACEMLGWSVDQLRPLKAPDMSSTEAQYSRSIGRALLQEAVERGRSHYEWHYRTRGNRVVPTDVVATRVELSQGTAVMVQFRDIDREQQVERDLRLATSSLDELSRVTSTAVLMVDGSGEVRFATNAAVSLLRAAPGRPLGLLSDHGAPWVCGEACTWEQAVARAQPTTPILWKVGGSGATLWLEGTLERVDGEGGQDLLTLVLHDVSDRVRREVKRERELHRENHLARYNAMGDMAMAIAHELGQPLAAAGNYLGGVAASVAALAAEGSSSSDLDRVVRGVDHAAQQIGRASSIVAAVRAFVGHLEEVRQVVDLHDVLAPCLYFVRLRAKEQGVAVRVREHAGPLPIRCERVLTGQVVLNLCFNAVEEVAAAGKADPSTKRFIEIVTRLDGDEAALSVLDPGRGFARDPFEESFTSKTHGSGIGLALSYRIITRQHGRIWAERRPEGGSRFSFALPLAGLSANHDTAL